MFKPGQKAQAFQSIDRKMIREGEAIIVKDNGFGRDSFRSCDVRFVEDIIRDEPECPVYVRWIDTPSTTPVEEKEGEVLPCKHRSESLAFHNECWGWNEETEEEK